MRWILVLGSIVTLAGSFGPSAAAAQEVMLLPVGGTPELAASHGDAATATVVRELTEAGFTILAAADVQARARAAHVEVCAEPGCAHEFLEHLSLDLAVGVALWNRSGVVQAAIVLIDPQGHQVSASADGSGSRFSDRATGDT